MPFSRIGQKNHVDVCHGFKKRLSSLCTKVAPASIGNRELLSNSYVTRQTQIPEKISKNISQYHHPSFDISGCLLMAVFKNVSSALMQKKLNCKMSKVEPNVSHL